MGERELALSMLEYALRGLGLREAEARLIVRTLRSPGVVTGKGDEGDALRRAVPELRPHRVGNGDYLEEQPRPVAEIPE
jgi:hypothetical protein